MRTSFNPRLTVALLLLVIGVTTGCLFTGTASNGDDSDTDTADDTSITDTTADIADGGEPDTEPDTRDVADTVDDTGPTLLDPPTSVCGDSSDISGLSAISAGQEAICGLGPGDELICWGGTDNGLFGTDITADNLPPRQIDDRSYGKLDLGPTHACAIGADNQRPYCWGTNDWSYFIDASFREANNVTGTGKAVPQSDAATIPRPTAVDLPSESAQTVTQITTGHHHTCAIESGTSRIVCWGSNRLGQRGDGTTDVSQNEDGLPVSFVSQPGGDFSISNVDLVAAGGYHTCAVRPQSNEPDRGDFFCWGSNANRTALDTTTYQIGQSGDYDDQMPHIELLPVNINETFPDNPPALGDDLALGRNVSCTALDMDPDDPERELRKELHCWGDNAHRQASFQSGASSLITQPYQTLDDQGENLRGQQLSLDVGGGAICLGLDSNVYCWGDGLQQIGNDSPFRTQDFETDVIDVAVGASTTTPGDDPSAFACALLQGDSASTADNELRCWGNDPPGLSTPTTNPASVACTPG